MPVSIPEVVAIRLSQPSGADGFPVADDWERAAPISFSHDWQGKNADPHRQTEVRALWTGRELHLRFCCRYRTLHVFPDAGGNGRRDGLWDRDVAEVFLQTDRFGERFYKEFEVSPAGQWLDLDITPLGLRDISSGMRTSVVLDESNHLWTAELAIPMGALAPRFDPAIPWRANFFRCEGVDAQRFYSAWQPTNTHEPNFHVPERFGWLRFMG